MTKTVSQSIELTHEDDYWVARDKKTGVASQGKSRNQALKNLDEALELKAEAENSESEATQPDAPWFE